MCVLIFSKNLAETFLILRRIQRDITIHVAYIRLNAKHPLFLSDFNITRIFPTAYRKILKYHILQKHALCDLNCSLRTDYIILYYIILYVF
jgi:hypothetical protein